MGGHTDAALRRTGELADAWHPIGMRPPAMLHPPEYAQKVQVIHGLARKAGRDPKDITLSLRVPLELGPAARSLEAAATSPASAAPPRR